MSVVFDSIKHKVNYLRSLMVSSYRATLQKMELNYKDDQAVNAKIWMHLDANNQQNEPCQAIQLLHNFI